MKRVITYGTFDLLHQGHLNILKRAKALGDYLIVGVTSENYDISRGKLNIHQSLLERIDNVRKTGLVDEIIVEEYLGQKINDVKKHSVDIFAIGSDWYGQFDYLKQFCEVVYLPRTQGISSTQLRNDKNNILELGIVGNGRIAKRFVAEVKYVSGINVDHVFGRDEQKLGQFCQDFSLAKFHTDYDQFLKEVDAVYVALPHLLHYEFVKKALLANKHVLCEKPITLSLSQSKELYKLAGERNLILQEAIKTAYAPGFNKLVNIALSGVIGDIKDVEATFTKLINDKNLREYDGEQGGGALTELGSYPLLLITKLLGINPVSVSHVVACDEEKNVDIMNKISLTYPHAIATANTAIGVKKEGCCIISGTKGYIYVPAPWWLTQYFEIRFEDLNKTQKYFEKFDGDGLRYEISDFLSNVNSQKHSYKLLEEESLFITSILENYRTNQVNITTI